MSKESNLQVKVNTILVSGRKDETLSFSKYVKNEETGKGVDEELNERVKKTDELETNQLKDGAVTNPKLAEDSVGTSKVIDQCITESKLAEESVTEAKIKDGAVSNQKIAADTLTIDKFDPELRKTIDAATGLPDNLVELIQDIDVNIAKLNDTVYPITLGFSVSPNVSTMQTTVNFSVTSDSKAFTPDALLITKQINDATPIVLTNKPTSSGSIVTSIEGNREIFNLAVTKSGRTGKSTSQTRYICYAGADSAATISADIVAKFGMKSTTGVSFNPSVTTAAGQYIWLIVPIDLTINKVTSSGFDVTLSAVQTITTSLGNFKAYRTANTLTAATWNLVIS